MRDVTYVFYECEEVEASLNGLQALADHHPDLLEADLAILMEPSDAGIEAGCQGTLRVEVAVTGSRAHSARSWLGVQRDPLGRRGPRPAPRLRAAAAARRRAAVPRGPERGRHHRWGGRQRHPGRVRGHGQLPLRPGSLAGRGASRTCARSSTGSTSTVTDAAPGALPGLDRPAAADFVAAVGETPRPKFGWTDVARFSGLGVPALNFGPGDPALAHTRDEHVPLAQIASCEERLRAWLVG